MQTLLAFGKQSAWLTDKLFFDTYLQEKIIEFNKANIIY